MKQEIDIKQNRKSQSMNKTDNSFKKSKLRDLISKQLDHTDPTPLNIYEIRNYVYFGFSDDVLRPKYWRVLLNYYSINQFKTEGYYKLMREKYNEMKSKHMKCIEDLKKTRSEKNNNLNYDINNDGNRNINNNVNNNIDDIKNGTIINHIEVNTNYVNEPEYNMSTNPTHDLIIKDLDRTYLLNPETKDSLYEYREVIYRIMIVFYKSNPDIGYAQGMINMLIPIYYVLVTDKNMENSKYAEEDSYFLFCNLVADMRIANLIDQTCEEQYYNRKINRTANEKTVVKEAELIANKSNIISDEINNTADNNIAHVDNINIHDLNDSKILINQPEIPYESIDDKINNIFNILEDADSELYAKIKEKKIDSSGIMVRWILLMFSGDLSLKNTIWLWDRLISDSYRYEMVEYCCASVFILNKSIIMSSEYSRCLEALQSIDRISIETLFDIADVMRRERIEKMNRQQKSK